MPPTHDEIIAVLATIPDPEMPISIVDLGIVEDVRMSSDPHAQPRSHPRGESGVGPSAIADAGLAITVDITPTFVGCPALDMIRDDITSKLTALDGVSSVAVNFVTDPRWSVDRITDVGRASLREHGVTTPARCGGTSEPDAPTADAGPGPGPSPGAGAGLTTLTLSAATAGDDRSVACPFCQSSSTRMESRFGPTRCRMIYYCDGCRNTFEHLKRI